MISGKGCYIWQLNDDLVVLPKFLAVVAKEHNFSHLIIKVADGATSYNGSVAKEVVDACHNQGISVWGYQYIYGTWPINEAIMAKKRIQELGLDGLVIDAEGEYKKAGPAAAKQYLDELKRDLSVPIALSSYRWPSYHPEFPWETFMTQVDIAMPQVYWQDAHNPTAQLGKCVDEYRERWPNVPIIPTGSAYHERGWQPTEADLQGFVHAVKDLGLIGYNWWEWANAIRYGLWETIAGIDIDLPEEPPEVVTTATIKTAVINFRSAPDATTMKNFLMQLKRGTKGEILEVRDIGSQQRWVKIAIEGWIAAEYYGSTLAELD